MVLSTLCLWFTISGLLFVPYQWHMDELDQELTVYELWLALSRFGAILISVEGQANAGALLAWFGILLVVFGLVKDFLQFYYKATASK